MCSRLPPVISTVIGGACLAVRSKGRSLATREISLVKIFVRSRLLLESWRCLLKIRQQSDEAIEVSRPLSLIVNFANGRRLCSFFEKALYVQSATQLLMNCGSDKPETDSSTSIPSVGYVAFCGSTVKSVGTPCAASLNPSMSLRIRAPLTQIAMHVI